MLFIFLYSYFTHNTLEQSSRRAYGAHAASFKTYIYNNMPQVFLSSFSSSTTKQKTRTMSYNNFGNTSTSYNSGGAAGAHLGTQIARLSGEIRPREEDDGARAAAIVNAIKGTLAPDLYSTRPPPVEHPSTQPVAFKESTTMKILPPPLDPNNMADTSTGAFLFFFKEGPMSGFLHMGFIPAGTQLAAVSVGSFLAPPGLPTLEMNQFATWSDSYAGVCGADQFTFSKALALPWNRASGRIPRFLGANLAQNFTKTRNYSTRVSFVSDTVQLNTATIAGNVTVAVLTDTLALQQNSDGSEAYSNSDIVNGSRWKPETIQSYSLADGVTILQGPDIPRTLQPVDPVNRNKTDGAWESLAAQMGLVGNKPQSIAPLPSSTNLQTYCMFGTWVSPYGITALERQVNMIFTNVFANNIACSPIPETGMLAMRMRFPVGNGANTTNWDSSSSNFTLVFEHVFASLDVAGAVRFSTIADIHTVSAANSSTNQFSAPSDTSNLEQYKCQSLMIDAKSDPRSEYVRRRNLGNDPGKYVGTKINFFWTPTHMVGNSISFTIGAAEPLTNINQCVDNIFEVCATTINEEGVTGPCTIVRYEDVAVGQNMKINSIINTENLAKGSFTQFTTSDQSDVVYDANYYSLLDSFYFGPHTDFRCAYTNKAYAEVLRRIQGMQLRQIQDVANMSPVSRQIGEAAGLFDGLRRIGSSALNFVRNNPVARQIASQAMYAAASKIPGEGGALAQHAANMANDYLQSGSSGAYFGDANMQDPY